MYLPGILPLCDPAVAVWAGESSRRYDFAVVRPATAWLDEPAVFILAKRDGARDVALYIGQTGSLQRSFGARALCPDVWTRAMAMGMTHLHLRFEACSVGVRRAEVRDLVAAQRPPLNEELRHEASAMARAEAPMVAWTPSRPLIPAGLDPSPSRPAVNDRMPFQALGRRGTSGAVEIRPARPLPPLTPRDLAPPSPGLPRGTLRADPARGDEPNFEQPPVLLAAAASDPEDVEAEAMIAVGDVTLVTREPLAEGSLPVSAPDVVAEPDPLPEIATAAEAAPPAALLAPLPPLAPGWTVDTSACSTVADSFPAVAEAKAVDTPLHSPGLLGRLRRLVVERTSRLWQGERSAVTAEAAVEAPRPIDAANAATPLPIIEAPAAAAEPIWLTPVAAEADAGEDDEASTTPAVTIDVDEPVVGHRHEAITAAAATVEPEQAGTARVLEAEEPVAAGASIEEPVFANRANVGSPAGIAIAEPTSPPGIPAESERIAETAGVTTDETAKRALGLDPTAPCLLFASELSYAAGADILVDALRVVCTDDRRLQIVFAGDGPMRADLHDRAQSAGIAPRCRFLGDVPAAQFEDVLAACDFVVIPARERQSPDLAALALLHSKPVLATHQAGIGVIVHGQNGLVTYDNPGSFVWGIRELLGPLYRDLRRRLAEAA